MKLIEALIGLARKILELVGNPELGTKIVDIINGFFTGEEE